MNRVFAMNPFIAGAFCFIPAAINFGLAFGLQKYDCDKPIRDMAIVMGSLWMVIGVLVIFAYFLKKSGGIASMAVITGLFWLLLLALIIVTIYTMYLLYRSAGLACWKKNRSSLWISYVFVTILTLLYIIVPFFIPHGRAIKIKIQ